MRNSRFLFLILSFPFFLFSCATPPEGQVIEKTELGKVIYAQIYVEGLSCPFCAYGLEKKLKEIEGLLSVKINIDEGRVNLIFEGDRRPAKGKIEAAVNEAGFSARALSYSNTPFL